MSRLPPRPHLIWKPDGTPLAADHDDVYFSRADGLAETRAVFLQACGLPKAWAGRENFTIGELGFGTGLNFLALWQLWQGAPASPSAWLHFVSFEGALMRREEAGKTHAQWPELKALSDHLLSQWPVHACGVQRLVWPDECLTLTLHIGDIGTTLPGSVFRADAWFLDGFSPAKNPAMWAPEIYPRLADRSRPGAQIGTYTVAGAVRQGLREVGFDVAKAPGFGKKRERLQAAYKGGGEDKPDPFGLRAPVNAPKKIAVIGGGVAGMFAAARLAERGAELHVFERNAEPAMGASGNPLALVMPRLDLGDTVEAQLLIAAYLAARRAYDGLAGAEPCDVVQQPKDSDDAARLGKLLEDPPFDESLLTAGPNGAVVHRSAFLVRPSELWAGLSDRVALHCGAQALVDLEARTVNREPFDAIILATGMGVAQHAGIDWLSLKGRLGQVEYIEDDSQRAPEAWVGGHYALEAQGIRLTGATFEAAMDDEPVTRTAARVENLAELARLHPDLAAQFEGGAIQSRAGIRATTSDFLPIVGALPDFEAACQRFESVRHGVSPDADAPLIDGIYLVTGLGSRGFTFAPLLADILRAQLFDEPCPVSHAGAGALSPMRFIFRGLKRGHL